MQPSKREPFPSETADRFQLRMPDGLRDQVRADAAANSRSMNAEIVARLEAGGETLRDRFAMAALDRMISLCEHPNGGWDPVAVAAGCYAMADAMMAERAS